MSNVINFFKWIYESSPMFFLISGVLLGFQLFTLIATELGVWLFTTGGFIAFMFLVYLVTWVYAVYKDKGFGDWWFDRPWRKDDEEGIGR